jgi:hypothetical protein
LVQKNREHLQAQRQVDEWSGDRDCLHGFVTARYRQDRDQ